MEKTSSSRTLYHCLSLAEVVGYLALDLVLVWASRLQKFSLKFLAYSPRNCTREGKQNTSDETKEEQELKREHVDIILERLGMTLTNGRDKLKDCMGFDEISATFEEKEPGLDEVEEAFCVFDENRDGFIDAKELQKVLCKLGFREGADLDACKRMIETYDQNKDGKIDFTEFARFMERIFC